MPLTPGRQVPAAAQKIDNSVFLVCGRVGEWWVGGRARNEGSQKLSKNLLRHYANKTACQFYGLFGQAFYYICLNTRLV